MIVLIGSTHDDRIFFESLITQRRKERILKLFDASYGKLFGQDVCLVCDVYTNYRAQAVCQYLIEKYFVILVLSVGTCRGFSPERNRNDVVVSRTVVLSDVNQVPTLGGRWGELRELGERLESSRQVLSFLLPILKQRLFTPNYEADFVSSSHFYTKKEELEPRRLHGRLFGLERNIALDCTLGGIGVACSLYHVPFIALKVVEGNYAEPIDVNDYASILQKEAEVGRVVVNVINDISQSYILEE